MIQDHVQARVAGRQGGFSLVEVMAGALVLVIASAGGLRAMVDSMEVRETNRENTLAQFAARGAIEQLRVIPFEDVFATFNANGFDDPEGWNTAPGAAFDVLGLDPQEGDPDGMCGRFEFPIDPAGSGQHLFETYDDPSFGMPRDLTGEGTIDGADHAGDYRLLPIRAVIEWRSASGATRSLTFETLLSDR